jgi:SAM-dependent methyltransferase
VQNGFPSNLLSLLCCPKDGGRLEPGAGCTGPAFVEGAVRCCECSGEYHIRDGILSLLAAPLHPESERELQQRDLRNESVLAGRPEWSTPFAEVSEVAPTLAAVSVQPRMVVGELGCGTGRYTLALADRASAVVAVDFSWAGLAVIRKKLSADAPVALVQADVTAAYAGPQVFDRVLSTLHSNLPDRACRMASLRHVASSLKDGGRAVISMHHYALREFLLRQPRAGRYEDSGIFRYCMVKPEARRESRPFFRRVRFAHVSVGLPGVRSLVAGRIAARIPLIRSGFGRLLLALAEDPRRDSPGDDIGGAPRVQVPRDRLAESRS